MNQFIRLPTYLSVYLAVCLAICLSVCMSTWLSVWLSVCLSVCLPGCLSDCLSVCLDIWPSIRYPFAQEGRSAEHAFRLDAINKGFQAYPFCLVMEAGDDTLKRLINDQHIAGNLDARRWNCIAFLFSSPLLLPSVLFTSYSTSVSLSHPRHYVTSCVLPWSVLSSLTSSLFSTFFSTSHGLMRLPPL